MVDFSIVLSVVVCTLNRAGLLRGVLDGLANQQAPGLEYEVVVVDNGCVDGTSEVILEYENKLGNFRYVSEPTTGLSHARNKGWEEAQGLYVGYLDDDCRVPREWVAKVVKIIKELNPGAFGGPYYGFLESGSPGWFHYGDHVPKEQSCFLGREEWWALSGGNLVIRRDLLAQLGGFDPTLGKRGSRVSFGEETELLKRLFHMFPKERYYYERDLVVYHRVDPRKTRLLYTLRARFAGGRDYFRVKGTSAEENPLTLAARMAIALTCALGKALGGGIWRDRRRYPFYHNFLWEGVLPDVSKVGYMWASLKEHRRMMKKPQLQTTRQ